MERRVPQPSFLAHTIRWVPHPLRPAKLSKLTFQPMDAKGGLDYLQSLPASLFSQRVNSGRFHATVLEKQPLSDRSCKANFRFGSVNGIESHPFAKPAKGWGTHGMGQSRKGCKKVIRYQEGHPLYGEFNTSWKDGPAKRERSLKDETWARFKLRSLPGHLLPEGKYWSLPSPLLWRNNR
jgi:hypothetical protein